MSFNRNIVWLHSTSSRSILFWLHHLIENLLLLICLLILKIDLLTIVVWFIFAYLRTTSLTWSISKITRSWRRSFRIKSGLINVRLRSLSWRRHFTISDADFSCHCSWLLKNLIRDSLIRMSNRVCLSRRMRFLPNFVVKVWVSVIKHRSVKWIVIRFRVVIS